MQNFHKDMYIVLHYRYDKLNKETRKNTLGLIPQWKQKLLHYEWDENETKF
jgi:hypothetical protein